MSERFVLVGVESIFAAEVLETLLGLGHVLELAVLAGEPEWDLAGLISIVPEMISPAQLALPVAVPWVTPGLKWNKVRQALEIGFSVFPSLADSHSSCARSAQLAAGVYLNAGAAVGAFARLDEFALVNRNASVGHHALIGAYASVGPGATIAARCRIGRGTMIGSGAVVTPGISVGTNCLVAAGAVISKDLPDNVMAAGNPARIVKTGYGGYKDALVP